METRQSYLAWIVVFLCFQPCVQGMPAADAVAPDVGAVAPDVGAAPQGVGALPPGVGELKTTIACENQKAYIACPNIFNKIDVMSAMFGRKDSMICLSPGQDPASSCTDQEEQIIQGVKDLCQGEDKCEVAASNDFLAMEGTVICPNILKYLEVKYRCMPKTSISDNEGEVTTNAVTEIVGGASSPSSSLLSSSSSLSSLFSNTGEVLTTSEASASASASALASASASSSPASEVQVLLDSPPSTRSESNVVEELGLGQSSSLPQSSQEVTESMQMLLNDKDAKEKVSLPNTIIESIKKSKIERVLPEVAGKEVKDDDANGSGMDELDEGDDDDDDDSDDDNEDYMDE